MSRLKPENIRPGRSYRLVPRYIPGASVVRRVEAIDGDQVVVDVNGERKTMSLKLFADMAVEEVQEGAV